LRLTHVLHGLNLIFVSASGYLDQLWNSWVSLKVFSLAMEHLGQLSHEAPGSASKYLDQP
jgi:hypothetical protein